MSELNYDKKSVSSIYEFALKLKGKKLSEAVQLPSGVANSQNRGDLGSLVEKYYFEHVPPNNHEPDFKEAGLELKITGIKDYKKPKKTGEVIAAKERLTLTTINYRTIVNEHWETSTLIGKCNLMMILLYQYNKDVSTIDQYFVLDPILISIIDSRLGQSQEEKEFILQKTLKISIDDLQTIKKDWEFIRQKIVDKKAHELSEGDTFYLGAARKGAGGEKEKLKKQNESEIGAKSRAFSLKQNFISKLVQGHSKNFDSIGVGTNLTFEKATSLKFQPFIGMSEDEISQKLKFFTKSKSRKRLLVNHILASNGKKILEFEKAGILIKTVAISKTGKGREHMSFPAFICEEVINQEWEESDFANQIENKFLLVVFQEDENGIDRLVKIMYWNMPYEDRLEAERVWKDAKRRLLIDATNLPKSSESKVAHVRPHAKDSQDIDVTPQGERIVKRSFWLDKTYIAGVVS
jgi:DNA mismatch repair protein MutH